MKIPVEVIKRRNQMRTDNTMAKRSKFEDTSRSNQRRTDNTMAKRSKFEDTCRSNQMRTDNTMAKRTTMIYKTLHRKLKIWATWTQLKTGGKLRCSRRVSSSCSTRGTRHVTLVTNLVISPWMRKGSDLRQAEYIHDHLWHRYSVAVN